MLPAAAVSVFNEGGQLVWEWVWGPALSRLRVIKRGVAAADRRGHVSPSPRWSVSGPGVTDMKRRRFRVNTADS